MTSETQRPTVYEAGQLRPSFLPSQPGADPALAPPAVATLEDRRARVVALERERIAWGERRERLQGDLSRARADCAKIRAELAQAEVRARAAEISLANANGDHDAAVIGHERFLRATAPGLVDEVLIFLRDQLDGLRRRGVLQVSEYFGPRNVLTLRRPRTTFTNGESIEKRGQAIRTAMAEWEACRLLAIDPAELQARAEALPAALPMYDETVEVPATPLLTVAESRELTWRLAEEVR